MLITFPFTPVKIIYIAPSFFIYQHNHKTFVDLIISNGASLIYGIITHFAQITQALIWVLLGIALLGELAIKKKPRLIGAGEHSPVELAPSLPKLF